MNETTADIYEQFWNPKSYLRQYYSTPYVPDDEQANFRFLNGSLQQIDRHFHRAIDVGCGPTLHHAMAVVPYVDELHLADYMAANLDEIHLWLNGDAQQHDWDIYFRSLLAEEGCNDSLTLANRKEILRQRITALKLADIRRSHPLGDGSTYDLVMSFYCIEAVAASREEWVECIRNVSHLVAPGGVLFMTAMRNCNVYNVFDREFPVVPVSEDDFAQTLSLLGFDPAMIKIRIESVVEWSQEGFDSICCVQCEKNQTAQFA